MTTTQFLKCMTPFFNIRLTLSRNEKKELEQKKKKKEDMLTNETMNRKNFQWKKSSNLP